MFIFHALNLFINRQERYIEVYSGGIGKSTARDAEGKMD
jgi:hypothetical protein